jgi:hypothetical protein
MAILEILVRRRPRNIMQSNIYKVFRASKRRLLQDLTILSWDGFGALRRRRGFLHFNFLHDMWLKFIKILGIYPFGGDAALRL